MPFDSHPIKLSALDAALAQMEAAAAERRAHEIADTAAAHCALAQKIIANNQAPELGSGLMGAVGIALSMRCPRTAKRKAAETLAYLRKNRLTCKRQGRNHHLADAQLLRRARILRECAIEFAEEISKTG
ncbi:hypothetical protein [Pelagibius sp. Alg239-R121]|uniref:hypothetical protein n=1 Tax=Pelagibius sp. Alg239-R121 TaxID=2993448 RepID=UPI0024A70BE1|nr:hypothetical protein [Pelagibius sp. Alg239-R121]